MLVFYISGEFLISKALWAAHGWIAQCQVYFCPCGKTSLWAKLLVWKYMSPARSFAWKSSDFHGKRLAQALVLQIETQTVEVKVYICAKRPIRPALIKNNLTKKQFTIFSWLFTYTWLFTYRWLFTYTVCETWLSCPSANIQKEYLITFFA